MATPYLGEIRMFGGNYAPVGWSFCNGDALAVNQFDALFSLLGTSYGGNGVTTFNLPDLRGRLPMHKGTGPGLTARTLGQSFGTETVTLTENQIPNHNHVWMASANAAAATSPQGNLLAHPGEGNTLYEPPAATDKLTNGPSDMISSAGGNQAHTNVMPFLALSFIVAMQGIYPSRN